MKNLKEFGRKRFTLIEFLFFNDAAGTLENRLKASETLAGVSP
jgi:hypothetical protein